MEANGTQLKNLYKGFCFVVGVVVVVEETLQV
jgi:hypothetical protein